MEKLVLSFSTGTFYLFGIRSSSLMPKCCKPICLEKQNMQWCYKWVCDQSNHEFYDFYAHECCFMSHWYLSSEDLLMWINYIYVPCTLSRIKRKASYEEQNLGSSEVTDAFLCTDSVVQCWSGREKKSEATPS